MQVNTKENVDLFKALKGGGPNFGMPQIYLIEKSDTNSLAPGIVTRFDIRTFPGSELWYQFVVYNASDKEAVLAASVAVEEAMRKDNRIGFFLTDTPATFTAGMIFRGGLPSPDAFKAFDSITPLVVAVPPTNGTFESCAITASLPNGPM